MSILGEQVINLIWNMFFVSITTAVINLLILRKDTKKEKIFTCVAIVIMFLFFSILSIYINSFNQNISKVFGILNILYEIFSWILITVVITQKYGFNTKISMKITKTEKILFIMSIIIGSISIITLFNGNSNYIAPIKNNFYIGNYYFNADIHRSIVQISSAEEIIHNIHPLYRFIVLPLMLPIIIMNMILKNNVSLYTMEIINGYIACVFQVIYNSISAVLMYKVLKNEKLTEKSCIIGAIIFIFSLATIWASILPETYAITTLMLLLFVYLYQNKNLTSIAVGVMAIGGNIMATIPVGIASLIELVKNKKKIIPDIKLCYIFIVLSIVVGGIILLYLSKYVFAWINISDNVFNKVKSSINYFLIPLLLGPKFTQNIVYFVQLSTYDYKSLILFTFFFAYSIVRLYCQ